MTTEENTPILSEPDHTLTRLFQLVETSQFGDEEDRAEILRQIQRLKQEMQCGSQDNVLPETFHAALQQTETFAFSRLGDDLKDEEPGLSWEDFKQTVASTMERWEGNHPKLAAAFMDFTSALSKLGI